MRGADVEQSGLFSYVSVEDRVPKDHPLRGVRALLNEALETMHRDFERVYAEGGRASIPPERLVRALTLQILYSIRSERLLCEQLDYNLLFRWFVGLSVDEPVCVSPVYHSTSAIRLACRRSSGSRTPIASTRSSSCRASSLRPLAASAHAYASRV